MSEVQKSNPYFNPAAQKRAKHMTDAYYKNSIKRKTGDGGLPPDKETK